MNRKKRKAEIQKLDTELKETYKRWIAVQEDKRSFFRLKTFSSSKKELEVERILKQEGIRFYREISFDMVTRFDFYIPLIDLVIEYDGWHHFNLIDKMKKDRQKEYQLKRIGLKLFRMALNDNLEERIKYILLNHHTL